MASLFQGSPQTATTYATTATETPRWMQDAIYNQIQWSQNVANTPYQPYELPTVAELSPLQKQAYENVVANQGAWKAGMAQAQSGMAGIAGADTAGQLRREQGEYLRPQLVEANLQAGQNYFNRAGGMDIPGVARPYAEQAMGAIGQSLGERALTSASPYLNAAARTAASQVGEYMSPYTQNVLNTIARQGARNLQENILPATAEAFIKAGQFGSSRMGEFGSRAVRDTQQAILDAQSQAAQQGYAQSLGAAQADLARQAQLAGTVGGISQADLSRILQGGAQYGDLAQTMGGLTAQQMSQLANLGQAQTQAGQVQQGYGINAAQAAQQAQSQDLARQASALSQMAQMAQQSQAMSAADVAALEAAGAAQQSQLQRELNAAQQQYQEAQLYPKQQLDWLNTQIRGMAPITPQVTTKSGGSTGESYSASPLSQLASGLAVYKGLQNV